ncbi:MAG: hypothetical protein ACYDGM_01710 [Vulcanimicrobiaceae bacterium]
MKSFFATLLCAFALAGNAIAAPAPASPGPASSPAATASPNAPVLARARAWLGMMQRGKIDRTQLTPQMDAALTDTSLASLAGEIGPFGAPTSFAQLRIVHESGTTGYVYAVTFKNGTKAVMVFALDDATGKINGLRLTPSE